MSRGPDEYNGNLAKSSGKTPVFMLWVEEVGKLKFRRQHGEYLEMRNERHMAILNEWYQELPEEERNRYKQMEKGEINTTKNYLPRRHRQDENRRARMHGDFMAYLETREKHKARIHQQQDELVRQQGPIHMPKERNIIFTSNTIYSEHFNTRRVETITNTTEHYKFFAKDSTAEVLDMKHAFIGATPACSTIVKEGLAPKSTHTHRLFPSNSQSWYSLFEKAFIQSQAIT